MKTLKSYIVGLLALIGCTGPLVSCQDHFDEPDMEKVPVATMEPNTTISEIKELMWKDDNNYCDSIGAREDGSHYIIAGRVISSDYAGNCFKYIVLQDETGCLNFSINSYNLYLSYRRGQEIVVDLTGMHAGKYRGLFQIGFPSYNSSIPGYETSFMAPEVFSRNMELNGNPEVAKIDTIVLDRFSELSVTPSELRRWQSTIVRFNNVEFVPNSTTPTLSTYHSSGVTQQIRDIDGNVLDIRTSGYSNFWNTTLPEGRGDVVALLGYYVNLANSGGWQLTLIDINALQNFGNPTVPEGDKSNPYSIQKAIALQVNGQATTAWTEGYIVGAVAPEVETVTSNDDIEWSAPTVLGNTLVIGQTAETRDIQECLVVALPQGSALREMGALNTNPDNLGRKIIIRGTFAEVMGTYGLTGNSGASTEFEIEGKEAPEPVKGDGSEENPYDCSQIIAMNPQSTTEAVESGVWVKGYIVGYYQDYAGHFETAKDQRANILIADAADASNTANCVCIQLVAQTDVRNALNLVDNPGVLGAQVQVFGDVMKYNTLPGIKNTSNYKLDGSVTPPTPPTPSGNTTTLLGEADANGASGWTFDNVTIPSGISNVWAWREYSSKYYLNGSAFVNNTSADAESWAISPVIDMSAAKTASVAFDHAAKFQTTLQQMCGFAVREQGASTWTMLTIPTWPAAGSWTFANSGSIDLAAYAGKKIQVAFKYGSSSAGADTWEVKNLTFTTDATISVEGGDTPEPPTPPTPPTPPVTGDDNGTGTFNFSDPSTLNPAYSEADQVADGTTNNFKVEVKDVVFTAGSATVTNTGTGTGARLYHQASGAWSYRFYKNTVTTIAVPDGYHIVKIEFEPQTTTYNTAMGNCTYSSGSYADKVWTPSENVSTLTITPAATIGWTSLTVTYAK